MNFKELRTAYLAFGFLFCVLLFGVAGYCFIEGWSVFDALYMTLQTVATVGYGEVNPLSHWGKVFTAALIVVSCGFYAYALTTIARYIANGVFRNYFKTSKVIKEIKKLEEHVIVVGYGRNGSQAIKELAKHKIPVVVIENRNDKIEELQQITGLLYLQGDPSEDEVLLKAGLRKAKALISVMPKDEDNLFVVLTSKELNPAITIISRAINHNTIKKLKTAGASHVIMPDKISGQQMAKMIAQPNAIEFIDHLLLEHSSDFLLDELSLSKLAPDIMIPLGELINRSKVPLNVIGVKRHEGNYLVNPGPETLLISTDILFVLGRPADIDAFKKSI